MRDVDASARPSPTPFWRELLARWGLCALVLAPLVVYAPRLLSPASSAGPAGPLGHSAPGSPAPTWMHLIVVTTGDLPAPSGIVLPNIRKWRERSSHARNVVPATESVAGNAASLWTGRWAAHHGVIDDDDALVGGAWTLAEAARRSGAATAALLEAPLVSATRIGGFDEVLEEPELPLARITEHANAFLAGSAGRRTLLWVHLRAQARSLDIEPTAELDELLGALGDLYRSDGLWADTATLLVPLGTPPAPAEADAAPLHLRVPAWVGLPAQGWGGRRSDGRLALCDLTALLRSALRLPPPDPLRRESELHGRAEAAEAIARGWDAGLDALFHGADRTAWFTGQGIYAAPAKGAELGDAAKLKRWSEGAALLPSDNSERQRWWEAYAEREARARRNAVSAEEARIPRTWRGLDW